MSGQQQSPWARPGDAGSPPAAGGAARLATGAGGRGTPPAVGPGPPEVDDRAVAVAAELRAWRARAAATADPAWSREGAVTLSPPVGTIAGVAGVAVRPESAAGGAYPWALPATAGISVPAPVRPADSAARSWLRRIASHGGWLPGPVAVCAGVAVIIASGMRWATVRAYGFVEFTVRGTDPDQHGRLTVLLGILAVVAGLLLIAGRREWGRMLATMTGLMVLLTAVVDLVQLYRGGPFADSGLRTATTVGPGLWVIACCGFVVFVVGVVVRFAYQASGRGGRGGETRR
ncbi:hypothetical protein [Candidatus Frankia alpina]|uniref:hypothetical protein n=1 Tax=Candidatus Frankia alpina TaxID=2699483 RepID=UPI0013D2DAC1|nr:hypothetical protein [Candidatus Frankia alpina]